MIIKLLKEIMVYKNLLNRLFLSLFFFAVYYVALSNKYLLFIIGTLIYLFIYYEIHKFFYKSFFKLILLYLFLSYICFSLYFFISYDFLIFNIFVFTIILFDSFSFFTGKAFGNNYIFEKISPKKTLEGYLGGFFFTNMFQIGFFYFIYTEITITKMLIVVNLTIFISISFANLGNS